MQLTARLTHPNTITIFDYGRTHDGIFYYAMELLDGATLERIVAVDGAQAAGRVVRILTMACGALSEAHAIGLIHRDIKPANIMLCTQGGEHDVVKVLDFGLVKELEVDGDVELTGANAITGTPQYMAPESIREPSSVDARTDIYALGAVAYYSARGTRRLRRQVGGRGVQPAPARRPSAAVGARGDDPGRSRSGRARLPREGSQAPPADRRRAPAPARCVRRRTVERRKRASLVARARRPRTRRDASDERKKDYRDRSSPTNARGACGLSAFETTPDGKSAARDARVDEDTVAEQFERDAARSLADALDGMATLHESGQRERYRRLLESALEQARRALRGGRRVAGRSERRPVVELERNAAPSSVRARRWRRRAPRRRKTRSTVRASSR